MVGIGRITGRRIGLNRDGDAQRIILQVEMEAEDVRTVEMINQAGEDTNPPNGCRVIVIDANGCKYGAAVSDNITPSVDPGEKEFYSTDANGTAKKATINLNVDGDISIDANGGATLEILNGGDIVLNGGTKSAVNWNDLNTVLQVLVTAINAAFATKLDGGGANPGLTLDLTSAEVPEVKL